MLALLALLASTRLGETARSDTGAAAPLPTPTRLMVEHLPAGARGPPPLVSTAHPRLAFVPGDSDAPLRNGTVSAYRVVVRARGGGSAV
eukprot:COSAG04_NODE_25927_length_301_cov_1.767327_1_plen_88_part_10